MEQPSSSSAATIRNKSTKLARKSRRTLTYGFTFVCFLLVITFQSLALNRSRAGPARNHHINAGKERQTPAKDPTFYPLRDPGVPPYALPNKTWFMSTLTGRAIDGMPEHFVFPSRSPNNRVLCINPHRKSYALATGKNRFPANATVLRGLSFIADSFYDYENPWHSLNALSVFLSWMMDNSCARPARFVVFKNGEVVMKVGDWIASVLRACLGREAVIESLAGYETACFEKAVVFRRGLGGMSSERRHRLFEMIRCKAWRFCNASTTTRSKGRNGEDEVRISLIGREGKRAFKNESGVKLVMERECAKFRGCTLKVVHLNSMSFCDQVRVMRETDIVATGHGAQLSNMMFMAKGSSVMEMFPKGWLQGAGIGQFIYQWFASWSQMQYEGSWRDTMGPACPPPTQLGPHSYYNCFLAHKDQPIGLNETHLAQWTAQVLQRRISSGLVSATLAGLSWACPCDYPR